jgi:hypothetical protein
MGLLFRLPFLLLELLLRRLLGRDDDGDAFAPAPDAPPVAPPAAPRTAPPAPNLRAVVDDGHVDAGETLVGSFGPADDVGTLAGTATVVEPWDGYDGMPAAAVVQRVRGSDTATKAVVRLYEQQHKGRATVLRAAG